MENDELWQIKELLKLQTIKIRAIEKTLKESSESFANAYANNLKKMMTVQRVKYEEPNNNDLQQT